jgi:hypothetical protein
MTRKSAYSLAGRPEATQESKLAPGDRIHLLTDGLAVAGEPRRRGDEVVLDQDTIDAAVDRTGASWLDLVDDADAQTEKWGKAMFGRGEWPAELGSASLEPESPEWQRARREAIALRERRYRDAKIAEREAFLEREFPDILLG